MSGYLMRSKDRQRAHANWTHEHHLPFPKKEVPEGSGGSRAQENHSTASSRLPSHSIQRPLQQVLLFFLTHWCYMGYNNVMLHPLQHSHNREDGNKEAMTGGKDGCKGDGGTKMVVAKKLGHHGANKNQPPAQHLLNMAPHRIIMIFMFTPEAARAGSENLYLDFHILSEASSDIFLAAHTST